MAYEAYEYEGAYIVPSKRKIRILTADEWADLADMSEELASVVAGTVADGSITDAKLATGVKVGDVDNLTTTSKTNVVGAINEVDANANTAQAAVDAVEAIVGATALTTTAQTVTGAINELDTANSGMVTLTGTQVLTNKTLTSPILNTAKIGDGDAGLTITSADQTNASATATFPNIADAADEVVMKDTAQTLTLKTLTSPKIATTGAICDAGGDEYLKFVEATTPVTYVQVTSGDTTVAPKVQGAGETNTDLHLLGSGTGNVKVSDGTDPTKLAVFELNGATTSTATTFAISQTQARTITFPDATDTLVGKDTTDVLTNKTLETSCGFADATDNTKALNISLTGATTGKYTELAFEHTDDREIAIPDASGTLMMDDRNTTETIVAHDYAAGATDWTLSAAELLNINFKPTNANAPVNAIVADTVRKYWFINGTGQTLTVKTAAGTGITIANTKAALVMSDGTNVIRLTADS